MWDNEIVKEIFKVMTNCQVVSLMCHLKPTRRRLIIYKSYTTCYLVIRCRLFINVIPSQGLYLYIAYTLSVQSSKFKVILLSFSPSLLIKFPLFHQSGNQKTMAAELALSLLVTPIVEMAIKKYFA